MRYHTKICSNHSYGNKQYDAVILVDDTCTLCNRSVAFIENHGRKGMYSYISVYSERGKEYLKLYGLPEEYDESLVLLEKGKAYIKSSAVLRIARKLNGALPVLYLFIILPSFLRDTVYMFVSRHRHKIG